MKTDGRTVLGLLLFRTACIDNDKAVCCLQGDLCRSCRNPHKT